MYEACEMHVCSIYLWDIHEAYIWVSNMTFCSRHHRWVNQNDPSMTNTVASYMIHMSLFLTWEKNIYLFVYSLLPSPDSIFHFPAAYDDNLKKNVRTRDKNVRTRENNLERKFIPHPGIEPTTCKCRTWCYTIWAICLTYHKFFLKYIVIVIVLTHNKKDPIGIRTRIAVLLSDFRIHWTVRVRTPFVF